MPGEKFDISNLDGPEEEYRFIAGRDEAGERIDTVLSNRYKWLSRSEAKKQIMQGRVFVERGEEGVSVTKGSFRLAAGDHVVLVRTRSAQDIDAARAAPPEEGLAIIHEDDCLIVVDKPAGIPVHPVGLNLFRTVLTVLHRRCRDSGATPDSMPILAHRLDVETSGVLLAVRGREEAGRVADQFRKRTVQKEYRALVYGSPERDRGLVDLPLGPAEGSPVPYKQAARPDGSPARTRFEVERRGNRVSLLRLWPETGRKHQLRVHMAASGHAVVGDKIYGPDEAYYFKARSGPPEAGDLVDLILPRQALHASRLALRHPRSGEKVVFESPLPGEFLHLLNQE